MWLLPLEIEIEANAEEGDEPKVEGVKGKVVQPGDEVRMRGGEGD